MMSQRFSSPVDAQASTVRQLKWLVAILIASNIGLGLFSVYVLREVDRNYSTLVTQAVPSLNELQTLTAL